MSTKHPKIYNLTLTGADTEYTQKLPFRTKKVLFQCRTSSDVRYAFATGKVATPTAPYMTLKAGVIYYDNDINFEGLMYFASADAGVIVEIQTWD